MGQPARAGYCQDFSYTYIYGRIGSPRKHDGDSRISISRGDAKPEQFLQVYLHALWRDAMNEEDGVSRSDWLSAAALYCTVVLLLLITSAIASPGKSRRGSSRDKACRANMKQLAHAKAEYAREHRLSASVELPDGCLWAKNGYIKSAPECPSGGTYTVGVVDETPRCSVGGKHSLD